MKPARKRQMVDHARAKWQVSIRRACHALPLDGSTYQYRPRRRAWMALSISATSRSLPGGPSHNSSLKRILRYLSAMCFNCMATKRIKPHRMTLRPSIELHSAGRF
jgi:hypothetical protein